jgi:hypothetical protein
VIAEAEAIVVEVAERTVACCAAVTVAMAGAGPATYGTEGSHALDSVHQGAFHLAPSPRVPCLEACRYSVDDGASGRVEGAYAAGPWATGPCCSVELAVDGMTEAA